MNHSLIIFFSSCLAFVFSISPFPMEDIVAPIEVLRLDIELAIENQVGLIPLAFAKMDKSNAPTCNFFEKGQCKLERLCPYRHYRRDKNIVCKHWLRGLCKKADDCQFLHQLDQSKMPECYFFSMFNSCTNRECIFQHISKESKIKECPWFNRGFCRRGPNCRLNHIFRVLCPNYIAGFCPNGLDCQYKHGNFYVDMGQFKHLLSLAAEAFSK